MQRSLAPTRPMTDPAAWSRDDPDTFAASAFRGVMIALASCLPIWALLLWLAIRVS